jgi:sulfur relay (sulfurtransferase) DsrF/TusC family protein
MQVLQIIDNAYRATIEEQDDTVLWITQVLRSSGASTAVLLRGSAVNYAVAKQDAAGVVLGEWRQTQPPNIAAAIAKLMANAVAVYADADDLAERGIGEADCLAGVRAVAGDRLAELLDGFDRVWQW